MGRVITMLRDRCWAATVKLVPRRHRWAVGAFRSGRVRVSRNLLGDVADLRRGNYPDVARLYSGDPRSYLNERERETRSGYINGAASVFLDDKLVFQLAMPPELTPQALGVIVRGRLTTLHGQPLQIADLLDDADDFVVRPARGRKGKGVSFVHRRNGLVHLNGVPISVGDLQNRMGRLDYHLITRFVQQHPYSAEMFAGSVNTLRLISMRDPSDGEAFIAVAYHRVGTVRSAPVDNFSAGGLAMVVDLESGRLGSALVDPALLVDSDHPEVLDWLDSHPDTGAIISGRLVPGWRKLLDTINEAMNALPMLHYVGWDVVQTERGPIILEGNNLPDLPQVFGGLLGNERVRRFYEHFDVIPKQNTSASS